MHLSRRRLFATAGAATLAAVASTHGLAQQVVATAPSASPTPGGWPQGYGPGEVGLAVATRFLTSTHVTDPGTFYSEVCAWLGALQFARVSGNTALLSKLVARFDTIFPANDSPNLPEVGKHVDFSMFGALPLELYIATGKPRYRALGLRYADAQWSKPDAAGLSHETRFWIDDMYMVTILQVQAFRATKNPVYLDRAAVEVAAYLDKLQQPSGLFFHAPDAPFFWGRGNGWFAVGMAELLRDLPAQHPQRARILLGYRRMMSGLLNTQAADGSWRQLLDRPDSWAESSGSGMFAFAFISGTKAGWLDARLYGPATHRAWQALAGYVDQNGDLTSVCEGTVKENNAAWYLNRKRRTGDLRGQATVLWSAAALGTA